MFLADRLGKPLLVEGPAGASDGLREIQARCPDCSGHGRDSSVLSYADGRVVVEHAAPAH